jgi:hypothetical protein
MEVDGQRHAPATLSPGKTRYPLYRRLGGPYSRYGRVRKISSPPRFDRLTVQAVASRYTDWAIHNLNKIQTNFTYKAKRKLEITTTLIANALVRKYNIRQCIKYTFVSGNHYWKQKPLTRLVHLSPFIKSPVWLIMTKDKCIGHFEPLSSSVRIFSSNTYMLRNPYERSTHFLIPN